jgi:hypothetical protein
MDIEVESAAGDDGETLPAEVRFGRRRTPVAEVPDRWYGPGAVWWKLQTGDGPCILRQDGMTRAWTLAAVPDTGTGPTRPPATAPRPGLSH